MIILKLFQSKQKRFKKRKGEKVFLILNPISGKLKAKNSFFDIIESVCMTTTLPPSVALTERKKHAEELASYACDNGFDRIICCGGDGTLNEIVNGVLKSKGKAKIGYIPSGTTNDFANGLGISQDIRIAAYNAVNGTDLTLDAGVFGKDFFTYIASFGIFTACSYSTPQQSKNVLGHFAYVLESLKDLKEIKTIHTRAIIEDKVFEGDYIFGAVSNTMSIGGLVKLDSTMVNLNDGLFELVLVKAPKTINDFNRILASVKTLNFDNEFFVFEKAEKISVELPAGTPWSVDGEMKETPEDGRVDISVSKHSITLTV